MTLPGFVRVVEHRRGDPVRVELRWWHPGCWRFIAQRLRREELELEIECAGRQFVVPNWIVAEVGAVIVVVRLAVGRAGA